jgi:hypothetical protein
MAASSSPRATVHGPVPVFGDQLLAVMDSEAAPQSRFACA